MLLRHDFVLKPESVKMYNVHLEIQTKRLSSKSLARQHNTIKNDLSTSSRYSYFVDSLRSIFVTCLIS